MISLAIIFCSKQKEQCNDLDMMTFVDYVFAVGGMVSYARESVWVHLK